MKAVLTVIAVALVWLCLKQPIPAAEAKAAPAEAAKPAKAAPVQEVIRAKRFELVDAEGKTRGELSMGVYGRSPEIRFFDQKGESGALLTVDSDGRPACVLFDGKGKPRSLMSVDADGNPGLRLLNEKGKTRAGLSLDGLGLFDDNGKVRAMLSSWTQEDGNVSLRLIDDKDKERATFMVASDDTVALGIQDENGRRRVLLGVVHGKAAMGFIDEKGEPTWSAP